MALWESRWRLPRFGGVRYFYEVEAFTASGRWYLGAITGLEGLGWYFYGDSYYGGKNGRASGRTFLNP